jgi:hypothetical protein
MVPLRLSSLINERTKRMITNVTEKSKTGQRIWTLRCSVCKPKGGVILESNDKKHLIEEADRHELGDHRDHKEAFPELYFGTPEHIEKTARSGARIGYQLNWLGMSYRTVLVIADGERIPNWAILPQVGEMVCVPQDDIVFNLNEIQGSFKKTGPNDHWAS